MALLASEKVSIAGLAAAVPANIAHNAQYEYLSEKERALLIKTTGIEQRRYVAPHQCASDLCLAAAEKLLGDLDWDKSEIQVLIFVSQTPDYITPATAITLQHRLGLPKSCLAFDINLGCSAYVYGLSVISSLMSNGYLKKGLLLVGDTSTVVVSEKDKSTAPIFSDAGSATALQWQTTAPDMYFNLQSDGKGFNAIIIPDGGARHRLSEASLQYEEISPGICRNRYQMGMNGLKIFNFTMLEVVPNIKTLLEHFQKNISDFDYFVFHQANKLLNERVRKKLKVDAERVPYSLKNFGNTSCATIPLTMVTQLQNVLQNQSLSLLLSGFGVGLSWGSAIVKTDGIVCSELIVLE